MIRHTMAAVLALPRTVFADNDEKAGKLVFGVEDASAIVEIRATLARLSVPSADYSVEITPPIHAMATLRDRFRPTQAGSQIHFFLFVCTMGFNVSHSGGRSFITIPTAPGNRAAWRGRNTSSR